MTELVRKDASASNGGELTAGTQTVAGNKTWSGTHTFQQPISGVMLGNDVPNLIINGNFDFWQRNTTFSIVNNTNLYTADRFFFQNTVANSVTVTRSTDVPTVAQSGFQSSYSLLATANSTTTPSGNIYANIQYKMEGLDFAYIHQKTIRVQFWAKTSLTGTYSIYLQNAAQTRSRVTTFTISSANTWTKITKDIAMDTGGTWVFDNNSALTIGIALSVGTAVATTLDTWESGNKLGASGQTNWLGTSSATFQIAQMALYVGSFASTIDIPFKRAGRTVGDELAMCQRYYEKSFEINTVPANGGSASTLLTEVGAQNTFTAGATANDTACISFKVTKRGTSGITFYGNNTGAWLSTTNVAGTLGVPVVADRCFNIYQTVGGGSTSYRGHWAADAEL
jgi:hypothetical protein